MDFQIAEVPREGDMLLFAQVLVAKEDHPVLKQRRTDFGHPFANIGGGEIDPTDFRADGGR